MTDCGDSYSRVEVGGQYLIQDVVASLAGSNLNEPVQTLSGLLDQKIPASGVVPLAPQTHHLGGQGGFKISAKIMNKNFEWKNQPSSCP